MKWLTKWSWLIGIGVVLVPLAIPQFWITDPETVAGQFTTVKMMFLFGWLAALCVLALFVYRAPTQQQWYFLIGLAVGMWLVPTLGSGDAFSAVARSQSVPFGANPFVTLPHGDIANTWLPSTWRTMATPYGPLWHYLPDSLFTMVQSVLASTWLLRLVCLGVTLGSLMLASRLGTSQTLKALVLTSPLLMFEVVNNAHPEGAMILFLLVALMALHSRRFWIAALAVLLATAVKPIAILALPVVVVMAGRRWWQPLLLAGVGGVALTFPFIFNGGLLTGIRQFGELLFLYWVTPFATVFWMIASLVEGNFSFHYPSTTVMSLTRVVAAALWLGAMWLTLRRPWPLNSKLFLPLAWFLVFIPSYAQPWYLVWVLPIAWFSSKQVGWLLSWSLLLAWLLTYGTGTSTAGLLFGAVVFILGRFVPSSLFRKSSLTIIPETPAAATPATSDDGQ